MSINKVNLAEAFDAIETYWDSLPVGHINQTVIKLVKFKGEFLWHEHQANDEIFLVIKGEIRLKVAGSKEVTVSEGEFVIIPAGTSHAPIADEEAHVLLIEKA